MSTTVKFRGNSWKRFSVPSTCVHLESGSSLHADNRGACRHAGVLYMARNYRITHRTRELHGPKYYHVGSPADPGYAREDVDPPKRDL